MNTAELAKAWSALHQSFGIGAPIKDEAQYEELLSAVEQLMDEMAGDEEGSAAGLVELLADRIREYESRVHPWPDTATPAQVLRFLMDQHGLRSGRSGTCTGAASCAGFLKASAKMN